MNGINKRIIAATLLILMVFSYTAEVLAIGISYNSDIKTKRVVGSEVLYYIKDMPLSDLKNSDKVTILSEYDLTLQDEYDAPKASKLFVTYSRTDNKILLYTAEGKWAKPKVLGCYNMDTDGVLLSPSKNFIVRFGLDGEAVGTKLNKVYVENIINALNSIEYRSEKSVEIVNVMLSLLYNDIIDLSVKGNSSTLLKSVGSGDTLTLQLKKSASTSTSYKIIGKLKSADSNIDKDGVDISPAISSLLGFIKNRTITTDKMELVHTIVKGSESFTETATEEEIAYSTKEADKEVKQAIADWSKLNNYDKWITTINNYIITGETNTGKEKDTYDMLKLKDLNFSQNKEEACRVMAYFNIQMQYGLDSTIKYNDEVNKFSLILPGDIEVNKSGLLDSTKAVDGANKAVNELKSNQMLTPSTAMIATYFKQIAQYLAPQVYGLKAEDATVALEQVAPNNVQTEQIEEKNISRFEKSLFLESIMLRNDTKIDASGLVRTSKFIGQPKNLRVINSKGDTAFTDLCLNLYAVSSYAATSAGLEKGSGDDYINSSLDVVIKENAESIGDDARVYVNTYRGIIEGLDYLGIEPWTPQLKAIKKYYDQIGKYFEDGNLKDYNISNEEPLSYLFNVKEKKINNLYNQGVSMSAAYIPMQTNTYDPTMALSTIEDLEFLDFHYKYGFYRKALMIDVDTDSAVNLYLTNKKSSTRPATLKDLLEYEKDIVLYLDDNFYNSDKIVDIQNYNYDKIEESKSDEKDKVPFSDKISEMVDLSPDVVLKNKNVETYSKKIADNVKQYKASNDNPSQSGLFFTKDASILSKAKIDEYIKEEEYSVLQPFAVVSAIYRHKELFDILQKTGSQRNPVFVSSPNLAAIEGVTQKEWNTIYNYLILKNLKEVKGIDYKSRLDYNNLIYMDVYGNIVTESGLVVVPAASNATLSNPDMYTPYTLGFMYSYRDKLLGTYPNSKIFMGKYFVLNEDTGNWDLRNKEINGVFFNFSAISIADKDILNIVHGMYNKSINGGILSFDDRIALIVEVLRGAPMESIVKSSEGLSTGYIYNKYGVYLAYKLEELTKQLFDKGNGNSLVAFPDLSFTPVAEYVVIIFFKLFFVIAVGLFVFKLYYDAVTLSFGFKTFVSYVTSLGILLLCIYVTPILMDISYYQVNKNLLSKEFEYISLLNLEKKSEGREVGIQSVEAVDTSTDLYVKLDKVQIPWASAITEILYGDSVATLDKIYEEAFSSSLMSNIAGVERIQDGLYVPIDYIFDSSKVEFNISNKFLYQVMIKEPTPSFVLPYYVILDKLITDTAEYNLNNSTYSYTTKIQGKGDIRTYGLIAPYLLSNDFMETKTDVTGIRACYEDPANLGLTSEFGEEDIQAIQASAWYKDDIDDKLLDYNLSLLDKEAKRFIIDNRDLIGKVSDETFLKVMALSLSLKHNDIFRVSPTALDIFDVDTTDILRLTLAPRQTVMEYSSLSFPRFTYEVGGGLGVLFASILVAVMWIVSVIKPLLAAIVIILVFISIIYKKMIKSVNSKAIEGVVITMAILCLMNMMYAALLKLMMYLPNTGMTPVFCVCIGILFSLMYIIGVCLLLSIVISDIDNFGFTRYMSGDFVINSPTKISVNGKVNIDSKGVLGGDPFRFNPSIGRNNKTVTKDVTSKDILDNFRDRR